MLDVEGAVEMETVGWICCNFIFGHGIRGT